MVDKRSLRQAMRARPPIGPAVSRSVVDGLFRWMSGRLPGTASAYLAMPGEVDVESLFVRLPGWRWVLPRVEPDGTLTFRDRDLPREEHSWGMSQPIASGDPIPTNEIDLMLVPGLAFAPHGVRLGRGGGFYDVELADRRPDCAAVGVTVEARVFDALPVEDHDQLVDFLATESGVMDCRPKS